MRAAFVGERVRLIGRSAITMRFSGIGRAEIVAPARARVEERGTELRFVRDGIVEWYANDPRGLEQGFDIERRPRGDGELSLELSFEDGGRVTVDGDVAHVVSPISSGAAAFDVTGLVARDARGRALASHFEARGATLRLCVDDREALYPIAIDPWYGAAPKKLTTSAPWTAISAGALAGDTAVIGDVGHDGTKGAAFVFVRDGAGAWTQQAKLVSATPQTADKFGSQVEIVDNTVAVNSAQGVMIFDRVGTTWSAPRFAGSGGSFMLGDGGRLFLYQSGVVAYTTMQRNSTADPSFYQQGGTDPPLFTYTNASSQPIAALSGTTLIAGHPGDATQGTNAGRVDIHVFNKPTSAGDVPWPKQATLFPTTPQANEGFGRRVAISGDIALVASGTETTTHALYVFTRSGSTWSQAAKITELSSGSDSTFAPTRWIGDAAVTESGLGAVGLTDPGAGALNVTTGAFASANAVMTGSGATWTPGFAVSRTQTLFGLSGLRVLAGSAAEANVYELDAALQNGTACTAGEHCMSGFCIDGVCCNEACQSPGAIVAWPLTSKSGTCRACTGALKGAGDTGKCEPVIADRDPLDSCPVDPSFPTSCKADGKCDGNGACRVNATVGTACGATSCASGAVSGQTCNGAGSCQSGSAPCAPFACGAIACKTDCATDDDCATSAYCAGTTCVNRQANGKICTATNQCASGFCVDGVCCESACNGQCQACAETGTAGKCVTVTGAPRDKRTKCTGDPAQCGGTCDGVNPASCMYAPATKSCATSCAAGKASKSTCDGAGSCAEPTITTCGAYACAGNACATACSTDAECTTGYACKLGACVPAPKGTCTSDRAQSESADGVKTACNAYLCDPAIGTCLTSCGSTAECAPAYLCENKSCVAAPAAQEDDGGCAMIGSPSRGSNGRAILAALAAIAQLARARRRRSRTC